MKLEETKFVTFHQLSKVSWWVEESKLDLIFGRALTNNIPESREFEMKAHIGKILRRQKFASTRIRTHDSALSTTHVQTLCLVVAVVWVQILVEANFSFFWTIRFLTTAKRKFDFLFWLRFWRASVLRQRTLPYYHRVTGLVVAWQS